MKEKEPHSRETWPQALAILVTIFLPSALLEKNCPGNEANFKYSGEDVKLIYTE